MIWLSVKVISAFFVYVAERGLNTEPQPTSNVRETLAPSAKRVVDIVYDCKYHVYLVGFVERILQLLANRQINALNKAKNRYLMRVIVLPPHFYNNSIAHVFAFVKGCFLHSTQGRVAFLLRVECRKRRIEKNVLEKVGYLAKIKYNGDIKAGNACHGSAFFIKSSVKRQNRTKSREKSLLYCFMRENSAQ